MTNESAFDRLRALARVEAQNLAGEVEYLQCAAEAQDVRTALNWLMPVSDNNKTYEIKVLERSLKQELDAPAPAAEPVISRSDNDAETGSTRP